MNTVMYACVYLHIYALRQFKKKSIWRYRHFTRNFYTKKYYNKCFIDKKKICKTRLYSPMILKNYNVHT